MTRRLVPLLCYCTPRPFQHAVIYSIATQTSRKARLLALLSVIILFFSIPKTTHLVQMEWVSSDILLWSISQCVPGGRDYVVQLTAGQCRAQSLSHGNSSTSTNCTDEWTNQLIHKSRLLVHMLRFQILAFSDFIVLWLIHPHVELSLFVCFPDFSCKCLTHILMQVFLGPSMGGWASCVASTPLGIVSHKELGDSLKAESYLGTQAGPPTPHLTEHRAWDSWHHSECCNLAPGAEPGHLGTCFPVGLLWVWDVVEWQDSMMKNGLDVSERNLG